MKILKHGVLFYFKCRGCGCEFTASKYECITKEFGEHEHAKIEARFSCPECDRMCACIRPMSEQKIANCEEVKRYAENEGYQPV